jgi:hypothetical protein
MANIEQDGERRRFFRIDDEVCLEYDLISEQEYSQAPGELEQIKQTPFGLSADFASLNFEYNPVLNSIKSAHPEIGQYFDFLNRKLDALSQRLLEEDIPCEQSSRRLVNISASGIAFRCTDKLEDNQPLRIRLVLLPEKVGIMVFGRALRNHQTDADSDLISIDFEHIRYEDQELMIKHNLNRQMQELRQRSEDNNED